MFSGPWGNKAISTGISQINQVPSFLLLMLYDFIFF